MATELTTTSAEATHGPIPAVSVGMPIFNGGRYLREAIESVLNQTFTDLELILSDNASTDDTEEICRRYAGLDKRVRYVRNAYNIGGADNFNSVFRLGRAEIFNWLPCDDLILPRFLETCIDALRANPLAAVAFTRAKMIGESGDIIRDYEAAYLSDVWPPKIADRYRRFMREVTLNYSITVPIYVHGVMRRDALARTHLQRHYLSQDDNLVAEVILQGEVCEVPEVLKYVRFHPGSSSYGAMTRFRDGEVPSWDGKHLQEWYRPGETSVFKRLFMRGWRHRVEYFRMVWAAKASLPEKLWMTRENLWAIGHRVKLKMRRTLHRP